jgi:hypothetical protein
VDVKMHGGENNSCEEGLQITYVKYSFPQI